MPLNASNKDQRRIYEAKSLDKALDILECFIYQRRELSLAEISKATALNKTTVKRLLSNLTRRNFLEEDAQSKRYRLGIRLFELGAIVFSSLDLRKAASSAMDELVNATNYPVMLGIPMDTQLLYVDTREGSHPIQLSSNMGRIRPLHFGMLGMVLIAHAPREKVEEILKRSPLIKLTRNSITDPHDFSVRLEKIRNDGYLIEREEVLEGLIGVAAPIRDYSRRVVASMGVAIFKTQSATESRIRNIVALVKKACDQTSANLGYT
jgi:IclR family transcriptional regulator, KDG regulon repressor